MYQKPKVERLGSVSELSRRGVEVDSAKGPDAVAMDALRGLEEDFRRFDGRTSNHPG